MFGWIGKILRVNLSTGRITEEPVEEEARRFLGARGLGAWYAWKELPYGADAFDEATPLIFMTGPLTGTLAPTSGRFTVCGIAPQVYPKPHYTRSNVGGRWGPTLKYAGYDGLIVEGRAQRPSYVCIEDGRAEIRDARHLWGLDTFETQERLCEELGPGTEVMCTGPAGERLARIAVIQSGLENAAGQGGFGAVMGAKNLKAIAVRGSGGVPVAHPERFIDECASIRKLAETRNLPPGESAQQQPPELKGCSMACTPRKCSMRIHQNAKGEVSATHCCSGGYLTLQPPEAGLRVVELTNRYGLNHWEVTFGFGAPIPIKAGWLRLCKQAGVFTDEDFGMPLELDSGEFWCELVRQVAYREGIGDALAEGVARAADILGKGHEYLPTVAYGMQTHWDGHLFWEGRLYGQPVFPYWLVSALMWCTDSRDPLVHGYGQEITRVGRLMPVDKMMRAGERVYGSSKAVAPDSGYEWKAQPTIWHQNRLAVKDSLCVCDQTFPLVYDRSAEDGYADVDAEARLFSLVTGIQMGRAELDSVGARIVHLERAIAAREGRTRKTDEDAARYFFKPDYFGITLDPVKFSRLLDEFYELRGWDVKSGLPTRQTLENAGLPEVVTALKA